MRESYGFNIPKEENGAFPLAAQDGAVDATKHKIKMFADDLRRMLKGDATKHRWQLVDAAGKPTDFSSAIAAMDQVSGRRASAALSQNKRTQKRNATAPTLQEREQQRRDNKSTLVDRLYSGKGGLESKLWPDA